MADKDEGKKGREKSQAVKERKERKESKMMTGRRGWTTK